MVELSYIDSLKVRGIYMAYQTEQQLENEMIRQLTQLGYEKVSILSIEHLQQNFRNQINRLNKGNLDGSLLSDKEFERLLLKIEGKSVFESAKILRDKETITRDDDSTLYLVLFDTQNYKNNHLSL
jgi:type I restriction enzyme R subunit